MEKEQEPEYVGWAIVELMGHRKIAGKIRDVQMAGTTLLRVDVPRPDGETVATQYYGGSAIYCVTPCDEAAVHDCLSYRYSLPEPVCLALAPPQTDDRVDDDEAEFDAI